MIFGITLTPKEMKLAEFWRFTRLPMSCSLAIEAKDDARQGV
jgi:hypothetical protein